MAFAAETRLVSRKSIRSIFRTLLSAASYDAEKETTVVTVLTAVCIFHVKQ